MENCYCVVTFHVTQQALVFEKALREYNLGVKLMPAPRQVSTSCGTAALILCEDEKRIREICNERDISFDEFHKVSNEKKTNWFLKQISK